jgi:hypothetical protein
MQQLSKTDIESKVNEALELIDFVASANTVRLTKALKDKLHKAEIILTSLI